MLRKVLGTLAVLAASACVSPYAGTPYERSAAGVQHIAVAPDTLPPELTAYEAASVGSNFGLIGALADAGIQDSREDAIDAALAGINFDAENVLEERIVAQLVAQGYEATALDGRARERRVFLTNYSGAPEGAEAYLDIVVTNYGYISAGAFQPFRPTAHANVRLVRRSDNVTLMENQIAYNTMYTQEGVITISANPEYAFQNRDALLADPQRLAAGITDSLHQIADTAAGLLR
jgi:hypothetical protein